MKKLYILLCMALLIGTAAAIEEIYTQTVGTSDTIRQYAVVNILKTDGSFYPDYCRDCSAYITLTNPNGLVTVDNVSMEEIDEGLFGYPSNGLQSGWTYEMKVKTISPTYGEGIVYSQLIIDSNKLTVPSLTTSSSEISDLLGANDFLDWLGIKPANTNFNIITLVLGEEMGEDINKMIASIKPLIKALITPFADLIGWVLKMINPDETSEALYDGGKYLLNAIIWPILYILAPIVMLYEMYVLGECMNKGTLTGKLETFFNLNFGVLIRLFNFIFNTYWKLLEFCFNAIIAIINLVISLIGAIIPG